MKNLKEIFGKSDWKNGNSFLSPGHGPEADWKLILLATIFLVIIASAFNMQMFLKINSGGAFELEEKTEETEATLDIKKLRSTVEHYQNKEAEFERIRSGTATSTVVDPSI